MGPDGTLWLGAYDANDHFRENMVFRCGGDGEARVSQAIAGKAHNWIFHGNERDARNAGISPAGLAAGPGGTVFVADDFNGRLLLLRPWPGGEGRAGGYSIEAIAGSGIPTLLPYQIRNTFDVLWEAGRHDALSFPLEPARIAVARDGTVLVADTLHRRIFQVMPRSGSAAGACGLEVAAGTGELGPGNGSADARETVLGLPMRLVTGTDGLVYCMTSNVLWELTPCLDAAGIRRWRSRSVSDRCLQLANAPDGSSEASLPRTSFHLPMDMAAGPFGGLLFTVPRKGIRYLDLAPGDTRLAEAVRGYREAEAAGDGPGAQAVREALVRQRDEPAAKVLERPLRFLAHEMPFDAPAGARPRLPEALRREIGSFVLDPGRSRFRAALALEAIRAVRPGPAGSEGEDPGADGL